MTDTDKAAIHAELMAQMLVATGVDDTEIDGRTEELVLGEAFEACLDCRDVEGCRSWLASGGRGSAPHFCANRDLFAKIVDGGG